VKNYITHDAVLQIPPTESRCE